MPMPQASSAATMADCRSRAIGTLALEKYSAVRFGSRTFWATTEDCPMHSVRMSSVRVTAHQIGRAMAAKKHQDRRRHLAGKVQDVEARLAGALLALQQTGEILGPFASNPCLGQLFLRALGIVGGKGDGRKTITFPTRTVTGRTDRKLLRIDATPINLR